MTLIGALHNISGCALLALSSKLLAACSILGELLAYVIFKIARSDYYY